MMASGDPGPGDSAFRWVWLSQTITGFGSQITGLALPTIAILSLNSSPFEVSLLEALQFVAFPIVALPLGVLLDRMPRRPTLMATQLILMIGLVTIPIGQVLGFLWFPHLCVVALLLGICTSAADVAYHSYVPSVVSRDQLLSANAKLEASVSAAEVAGPAVGGILIGLLTGAIAILVDVGALVTSLLFLGRVRRPEVIERANELEGGTSSFARDARAGLAEVLANRSVRTITISSATANVGWSMTEAVLLIFLYRDLGFTPQVVGLLVMTASVTVLLGTGLARIAGERLGEGRSLVIAALLVGVGLLIAPIGAVAIAPAAVFLSRALVGLMLPVFNINSLTIRQTTSPPSFLGRVNATVRAIAWITRPFAALLGGALAATVGVVPTLVVAGSVTCGSSIVLIAGGLHRFKLSAAVA
jgi:MFS family permease